MLNVKQDLDFLETINLKDASQYSDPLPCGSYLGLHLYFYGTYSSSVDNTVLGNLRLNMKGFGDIASVGVVNLQKLNNFLGGLPKDSAGTSFSFSSIIPFTYFGYPNALHVHPGDNLKLWLEKNQTTVTTFSCEISGIYGNAPENYIPIISQDRYNDLGGIQSEHIVVQNLMAIMLLAASTTNPDLITLESSDFSNSFSFASGSSKSDLNFNVESSSLGAVLFPVMNCDIADAINDIVRVKFSGGSGYMDYVTLSAIFDTRRRVISSNLIKAYRERKYQRLRSQYSRAGDNVKKGQVPGFDPSALIS